MTFSSSFKRVVPRALQPIARTVYHKLFRAYLRIAFWFADHFGKPSLEDAVPPAALRFRVSELISVEAFLRVGEGCANLIRQSVQEVGVDVANAARVLDFGCGCGRTIRWFLRQGGTADFHGVDVDMEAIDWCKQHLDAGYFLATAPNPPLPYPADYFDVVYCLSVFTHLDESMQDLWLRELLRILKPNGVLLLTIYGKAAIEQLDAADQEKLRFDGFVHRRSRKMSGIVPDWYQTTWHSKEYILHRLSSGFGDIRYHAVPDGVQDVVVARKLSPAASVPTS